MQTVQKEALQEITSHPSCEKSFQRLNSNAQECPRIMQKESREWGKWLRQVPKCDSWSTKEQQSDRLNHVLDHTHSCWVSHTFCPPASTTCPTLWILFALLLGIPRQCYSTFGMTFQNLGGLQSPGMSFSALSASLLLSLIIHAIPCSSGASQLFYKVDCETYTPLQIYGIIW